MPTVNAVGSVEGTMGLNKEVSVYASLTLQSVYVLKQDNRK